MSNYCKEHKTSHYLGCPWCRIETLEAELAEKSMHWKFEFSCKERLENKNQELREENAKLRDASLVGIAELRQAEVYHSARPFVREALERALQGEQE